MKDRQSQSHVKWDCKYHVVIVPKYRRRDFLRKTSKRDWFSAEGSVSSEGDRA